MASIPPTRKEVYNKLQLSLILDKFSTELFTMSLIFGKILSTVPYRLSLKKKNACTTVQVISETNGPCPITDTQADNCSTALKCPLWRKVCYREITCTVDVIFLNQYPDILIVRNLVMKNWLVCQGSRWLSG